MDHDTFNLRRSLGPISRTHVTALLLQKLTLAEVCQVVVSLVS